MLALALIAIPALEHGCGGAATGTQEAAPPSPPLETPLPIVLKFVSPEALDVDFSSLASQTSLNKWTAGGVAEPGDQIPDLMIGPFYSEMLSTSFVSAISGIQQIEIPVSTTTTSFPTTTMIFTQGAGGYLADGHPHRVRLDFSNFDFNNNGSIADEGCSGHTAALPVCVRFWLDDMPFIAGIFEEYPFYDASNSTFPTEIGKGTFKLNIARMPLPDTPGGEPSFFGVLLQYKYGELPDLDGSRETIYDLKLLMNLDPNDPNDTTGDGTSIEFLHALLAQKGADAQALKRLNLSVAAPYIPPPISFPTFLQYTTELVEGAGYWGGHIVWGEHIVEPPYDCATLPDGIVLADRTACADVGPNHENILVDDIPFFDFLDETSFADCSPLAFPDFTQPVNPTCAPTAP